MSAVTLCSAVANLIPIHKEEVENRSSHSTQCLSELCSVLVPTIQKGHGQIGEGPKESHEGDQKAGELAL